MSKEKNPAVFLVRVANLMELVFLHIYSVVFIHVCFLICFFYLCVLKLLHIFSPLFHCLSHVHALFLSFHVISVVVPVFSHVFYLFSDVFRSSFSSFMMKIKMIRLAATTSTHYNHSIPKDLATTSKKTAPLKNAWKKLEDLHIAPKAKESGFFEEKKIRVVWDTGSDGRSKLPVPLNLTRTQHLDFHLYMGVEPKIVVFPPKWMAYNGKPYFSMDDLGVP